MNVIIANSAQEMLERAQSLVLHRLTGNPDCVLGLGTDPLLLRLYRALAGELGSAGIPLQFMKAFCAQERIGKTGSDPDSDLALIRNQLLDHISIHPRSCFAPSAAAGESPIDTAARYEALIDHYGGIDLQILSLASDGSFQGNEPGSSFSSNTRVVFDKQSAAHKISLGLRTIRQSRQIMLLVAGSEKASAVKAMLENPASTGVPASSLQYHRNTTVILDQAAAYQLDNPGNFKKSFHGRLHLVRKAETSKASNKQLRLMDFIRNQKPTSSVVE